MAKFSSPRPVARFRFPPPPLHCRAEARVLEPQFSRPSYSAVILCPTFDNADTLGAVLAELATLGLPVVVIDDGSTDATAGLLAKWAGDDRTILTHPTNLGKAAALRTGFDHASAKGFTHAVTIDTDGQLSPADIPNLLRLSEARPGAIVVGRRDDTAADYPPKSRLGRSISNRLVWIESGGKVADSQCGLRVYPLPFVTGITRIAGHYGFETEILTRAAWAKLPIVDCPVSCRYFSDESRVSHFKPVVDTLRAVRMHGRLLSTAMIPLHRVGPPGKYPHRSMPRRLLHWMNPLTAWRQVRRQQGSRRKFSAGFAAGVFIGNLPLYGVQTILALFVARKFKLHPVSVVAGTNTAVPPISPVMIAISVAVGHMILHGSLPRTADYHTAHVGKILVPFLADWAVGGVVFGAAASIAVFAGLDLLLKVMVDRANAQDDD